VIPSFGNEGDRKGRKGNENGKETRGGKREAEEKTWKGREEVRKECWDWSLREGKGKGEEMGTEGVVLGKGRGMKK
jgi:hypothetical protein